MATKEIIIDGYIGSFGFSKQYVRNELSGNKKNDVLVKISSLGGSVDHAINIYDQFLEHGNVTAELSAFVASAATLLSLGAKKIRMNENSFYLIHKAMYWIDEWGSMNEDDIEEVIENLEKQKKELAKITLQLAKMYAKKTGKPLDEITDLMKQETWLTAEEAKEWGFVDEVYSPDVAENFLENDKLVAMINSNGFPKPPRKHETNNEDTSPKLDEDSLFDRIWKRILNRKDSENKQNTKTMKQFKNVNAALGVETLEAVDDAVSLNEEQLIVIDSKLSANDQAVADARKEAETERDEAVAARIEAEEDLQNAVAAFDAIDTTIASAKTPAEKAEAICALLATQPGAKAEGNKDKKDPDAGKPKDGVDWETINNLPHNKEADTL